MWATIAALALSAHPKWAIVQSDNRSDAPMVTISAYSYARFAGNINASYYHYTCNAKLAKPKLVESLCHRHDLILWADSDSVARPQLARDFQRHVLGHVRRKPELQLLFGVDYYETNQKVHKATSPYLGMFNAGVFVAVCPAARLLLNEWAYYAALIHPSSDQIAIQTMAQQNSIWRSNIFWDFRIFGVHSAYFDHYPGMYRKNFPLNQTVAAVPYKRRKCRWIKT